MSSEDPAEGSATGESELLAGLRRREGQAYQELLRRQLPRLLQVARRFVGDEEARDAVQDSFLAAFKAIDSFDGQASLATWLHRIVVNACLMRLRKKSARVEQPIEPLLPSFLEDGHRAVLGPAWPETPEEILGREEMRRLVHEGLAELPEPYRVVILLRDFEDLDGLETAELLGTTPGAVKVRLHRARQALREILGRRLHERPAVTSARVPASKNRKGNG
jgi:RNA polymerase sigma-70 factor (ECF subfamily)